MRTLDPEVFPRASAFAHYQGFASPHMALTVEVDATRCVTEARAAGRSLFASVLHALTGAVREVPELRQRLRPTPEGLSIVEHAAVDPAFTVGVEGNRFAFASVPYEPDVDRFAAAVAAVSRALRDEAELTPFDGVRDDVVYLSCLPWLRFTSLTHPVRGADDVVPRIAWGKLHEQGGRVTMPVNVQVHHALVDGVHLGQFVQAVEARLEAP